MADYRLPYTPETLKTPRELRDPITVDNLIPLYDLDYDGYKRYRYSQKANYTPYVPSKNTLMDYNNPSEINSMADIILKAFNKDNPNKPKTLVGKIYDFLTIGPELSNIALDTADYFEDAVINPISKGEFGHFGLNVLTNLQETIDVPGNIVKGAIFKSGTMKESLGYFDDDGKFIRRNFDVDSSKYINAGKAGNKALDILGEVVLDPMNWISFGTWAVAKSGIKGVSTELLKEAAGEMADKMSDRAFRRVAFKATNAYIKNDYKTMTEAVNGVLKGLVDNKRILPKIFNLELTQDQALAVMRQMQDATVHYNANVVLDSLKTLTKVEETLSGFAMKTALTGTGVYPAYKLLGKGLNELTSGTRRKKYSGLTSMLKEGMKQDGTLNIMDYELIDSAFGKYKNVIDASDKLNGGEGMSAKILEVMLSDTVQIDYDKIYDTFLEFSEDPIKFMEKLAEILEIDSEKPLWEYIKQLRKINELTDGAYDEILGSIQELNEEMRDKFNRVILEKEEALRNAQMYSMDSVREAFELAVPKPNDDVPNLYNLVEKKLVTVGGNFRKAVKEAHELEKKFKSGFYSDEDGPATLFDSLNLDSLNNVRNYRFQSKYLDPELITQQVRMAINNSLNKLINPILKLQISPEAYELRTIIDEFKTFVAQYQRDLMNELPNYKSALNKQIYQEDISKMVMPEFNFEVGVYKKREDFLKRIDDMLNDMRALKPDGITGYIPEIPELEGRSYSSSEKMLKTVRGQGERIDRIKKAVDTMQKFVKAEFKIEPISQVAIEKTQQEILEVFENDYVGFIRKHHKLFEIDPEYFIDTVEEFLRADTASPNDVASAWGAITSMFYRMFDSATPNEVHQLGVDFQHSGKEHVEKTMNKNKREIGSYVEKIPGKEIYDPKDVQRIKDQIDTVKLHPIELSDQLVDKVITTESVMLSGKHLLEKTPTTKQDILDHIQWVYHMFNTTKPENLKKNKDFLDVLDRVLNYSKGKYAESLHLLKRRILLTKPTEVVPAKHQIVSNDKVLFNFGDLLAKLESINPYKALDAEIAIKRGAVYRQLKQEQVSTILQLMNIESVNDLFKAIQGNTGMGTFINTLAKLDLPETDVLYEASISARLIDDYKDHYVNYKRFLDLICQVNMSDEIRNRFISTIQKYSNYKSTTILENIDRYFDNIIEETETFTNSASGNIPKLSLDYYREKPEIKQAMSKYKGKAHGALYDVHTLEEVLKFEGVIDKLNDPKMLYVLFDTETAGSKANQSSMFEIGYKVLGQDIKAQYNLKLDPSNVQHQPSNEILDALGYTDVKQFYSERSGEFTEAELFNKFLQDMKELKRSTGKNIMLVGHNAEKFDIDYMLKRMYNFKEVSAQDINIFRWRYSKTDSLTLLRKKYGYESVDVNTRYRLKKLISNYAERQTKSGIPRFISPNNSGLAVALKDISKAIGDVTVGRKGSSWDTLNLSSIKADFGINFNRTKNADYALIQVYNNISNDIWGVLQNIKQDNRALGLHVLVPELFDETHELYNKVMRDLDLDFKVTNPSQLLYAKVLGAINDYGYRNAVDSDILLDWFNITEGTKMGWKLAKSLTSLGKSFKRTKEMIKNVEGIAERQSELQRIIGILIPPKEVNAHLFDSDFPMQPLSQFYTNLNRVYPDALSTFVVAQYLFHIYRSKGLLTDNFRRIIGEDNIEFLNKKSKVFENAYKMRDDLKTFKIDADVARPEEFVKNVEHIQNEINSLQDIGRAFQDNDLVSARVNVVTKNLMPTYDMLNDYNKIITKFKNIIVDGKIVKTAYEQQVEFLKNVRKYTDAGALSQTLNVLRMTDDELYRHLVYNAPWIEFSINDLRDNKVLQESLYSLLQRKSDLKKIGIEVTDIEEKIYLNVINLTQLRKVYDDITKETLIYNQRGELIPKPKVYELDLPSTFDGVDDSLLKHLHNVRETIHDLSANNSVGTLGERITFSDMEQLYKDLPQQIKNKLPSINDLTNEEYFKQFRFNHIVLGSMQHRRTRYTTSNSIVQIYKKNAEAVASMSKTNIKYAELYFGTEFAINNSSFFDVSRDDDIVKAFANSPEYTLSALVEDKKYGYKVIKIPVSNSKDLAIARQLNAIVLPDHIFRKLKDVLNSNMMNEHTKNWWNKILYTFKVGYLLSPATWFRNYVDSTLKTIATTGDMTDTLKAQLEAQQGLHLYNKIVDGVMLLNRVDLVKITELGLEGELENALKKAYAGERLTALGLLNKYTSVTEDICKMDRANVFRLENLKFYFDKMNPEMDYNTYEFIHRFIVDGPSAGMTKAWQKAYGVQGTNKFWNGFVNTTNRFMEPNNQIEQVNRLAEYLLLARHGDDSTKAFYKVLKTHFDYGDKEPWQIYTELIFPFYTFSMKNLEYWVDTLSKTPSIYRQLSNVMTPVYDFDNVDFETLKYNKSLQYQILSGNIPISDSGLTLKVSPSFMDTFNIITDPLGAIKDKMFSPLQQLLDLAVRTGTQAEGNVYDNWLLNVTGNQMEIDSKAWKEQLFYNSMPILGTILRKYLEQGPTYYERTGNIASWLAPGLFGATKEAYKLTEFATKSYPKGRYPVRPKTKATRKSYSRKSSFKKSKIYSAKSYNDYVYAQRYYNKWAYPNSKITSDSSFYKKHYKKSGKSRLKAFGMPLSGHTLKYRIADTVNYYR